MTLLRRSFNVTEEQIERSREVAKELETLDRTKEPRRFAELQAEQERLAQRVLREMDQEVLQDLNSHLYPLLRGTLKKPQNETYYKEVYYSEKVDRWGWLTETISGKKMIYNPGVDEENRKYEPYPTIQQEMGRVAYLCRTNRQQVGKIEERLTQWRERVRSELRQWSIDRIIAEREKEISLIAKIDLTVMTDESFTQLEYDDAGYIQKPAREEFKEVATDQVGFHTPSRVGE